MAIMAKKHIYIFILAAALAITACAKRDSEFRARKNAAGATLVDTPRTDAANAAAAAAGYDTDILGILQPQVAGNALRVTSYLRVNATTYQVMTTHSAVGTISQAQQYLEGANFEVNGVCATEHCNPYYLIINITRNGQQIKQTAMKKFFWYVDANSSQDLILSRGPGEFLSVQSAISLLDQSQAQAVEENYF